MCRAEVESGSRELGILVRVEQCVRYKSIWLGSCCEKVYINILFKRLYGSSMIGPKIKRETLEYP